VVLSPRFFGRTAPSRGAGGCNFRSLVYEYVGCNMGPGQFSATGACSCSTANATWYEGVVVAPFSGPSALQHLLDEFAALQRRDISFEPPDRRIWKADQQFAWQPSAPGALSPYAIGLFLDPPDAGSRHSRAARHPCPSSSRRRSCRKCIHRSPAVKNLSHGDNTGSNPAGTPICP
jgi:hypothetical protein